MQSLGEKETVAPEFLLFPLVSKHITETLHGEMFACLGLAAVFKKACSCCRKLRDVLQKRLIKFFVDQSKKEPEKYAKFFEDYGVFMREGIVTIAEQDVKVPAVLIHCS